MLGRAGAVGRHPPEEARMTAHGTTHPTGRTGEPTPVLVEATLRLEQATALDRVVGLLQPAAAALVANPAVRDVLHGRAMGHAAHPLLTQVPIGTWASSAVLDLIGGKRSRPAATRLIGTGILAAVPTAVTGLAEWAATSDQPARRVGVVHAAANSVALLLYTASYRARRRGHHLRGVGLGFTALSVVSASGFLGAHLSLARKVATRDPAFAEQVPLVEEVASGGSPADAGGVAGGGLAGGGLAGGGRHRDEGVDPAAAI
jgi:Predicted membrane protein (DUF2231)